MFYPRFYQNYTRKEKLKNVQNFQLLITLKILQNGLPGKLCNRCFNRK